MNKTISILWLPLIAILFLFLGNFWRILQEQNNPKKWYCGEMEDVVQLAEKNRKVTYHHGEYRIYALKEGGVKIIKVYR